MLFDRGLRILSHTCIVLSLLLLILFVLDLVNPAMLFWDSDPGKIAMLLLCILSFSLGVKNAALLERRREQRLRHTQARSTEPVTFSTRGKK